MRSEDTEIPFEKTVGDLVSQDTEERLLFKKLLLAHFQGHTCIKLNEKVPSPFVEEIRSGQKRFNALMGRLGSLYYLQRNFVVETRILDQLKLATNRSVKRLDIAKFQSLNQGQEQAVSRALKSSFFCLTGGPGTGKTHTIVSIIYSYLQAEKKGPVLILTPTGKASSVLKKRIFQDQSQTFSAFFDRIEVSTLHRFFGLSSGKDPFWIEKTLGRCLCIVDEASMIDTELWALLLSSMGKESRLIVCGDPYQLPPVEIGSVFAEVCLILKDSPAHFKCLTKTMRTDNTQLLTLAKNVKEGKKLSSESFETGVDFEELFTKLAVRIDAHLVKEPPTKETLKEFFEKVMSFRLITPLRKGPFGTEEINKKAASWLKNNVGENEVWVVPIMAVKNDPVTGIYNGDVGLVFNTQCQEELSPDQVCYFLIDDTVKELPLSLLSGYEVSYALSVHKSQGSEFQDVVLLLPPGSENFGREVAYTGITRAKKRVRILSDEETMSLILSKTGMRSSGLSTRFCGEDQSISKAHASACLPPVHT